jgi:hypothetical protein
MVLILKVEFAVRLLVWSGQSVSYFCPMCQKPAQPVLGECLRGDPDAALFLLWLTGG